MKYLLDTNTCVQILRQGTATPWPLDWPPSRPWTWSYVSVVVAELLFGAVKSRDVAKNLMDVRNFAARFISLDFDALAAEE